MTFIFIIVLLLSDFGRAVMGMLEVYRQWSTVALLLESMYYELSSTK